MTFRRALLALLLSASTALGACAADPGDAPKGDDGGGPPSGDDATPPTGAEDSALPGIDSGPGDATIPVDSSVPAPIESGGPDHAGPIDAGSLDAADATPDGTSVVTCTSCPLVAHYMTANTSAMSNTMSPQFEIVNNGASPQDLSVVTLRYYYTAQGSPSLTFACDYFPGGCGSVAASFVAIPTPTATADHYLQIAFATGSIPSGAGTGSLQTRFYDSTFAVTFNQAMDYSFNAGDTAFTPWDHVTLYVSGSLVYGIEP